MNVLASTEFMDFMMNVSKCYYIDMNVLVVVVVRIKPR